MKSRDIPFFVAGAFATTAVALVCVLCGAMAVLNPAGWNIPALPGLAAPTAQVALGTATPRPDIAAPTTQVTLGTAAPKPGASGTWTAPAPIAVGATPPAPLPTRPPGTPAPALATSLRGVLYHDDFSSKEMSQVNGWKFEEDERTATVWSPNKFSLILKARNLIHGHAIRGEYRDFGIEIEAQPKDEMMFYGIHFRASKDNKSRYILSFLPGGYFLSKEIGGQLVGPSLVQSETPYLKAGASKNRLGLLVEGSTISIYVNGHLDKTVRDTSLSSGAISLFVSMLDNSPARVQLDISRVTIFTPEQAKVALPKTDASTAAALNGVLFFDDFSSEQASKDKAWKFETGADVDKTWSPNKYSLKIKKPGADASSQIVLPRLKDFGIEFEAQPDDVPGMEYGIQFRVTSRDGVYTGFYQLGITLDGNYWLSKKTETETSVLLMRAHSPLIKRGAAKNRVGVLADGNTISLFINGALVNTIRDDLLDPGSMWLWAYHNQSRAAGVAFNSVTVITPERAREEWGAQVATGAIVFNDDFSSEQTSKANEWFFGATQDNAGEMVWSPNKLSLSIKRRGLLRNKSSAFLQDFAVEIEAQPGNDAGTEYGILFHFDAKQGSEYLFYATLDGKYGVIKTIGGRRSENDPVKATPTSLLKPGAKNRLGLIADGSTISLYINGTLVQTFADEDKARGFVGVFVQALGERARVDISRVTILTVNKARAEWSAPGVLFHDDFSSEQASKEKGWILGPAGEADYVWSPNQLALKVKRNDNFARNYPYGTYRDFGVEIEAYPDSDFVMEYGILFRQSGSKETHSLYYFGVSTQGTYYLYKKVNGAVAKPALVEDTPSPHIRTGASKNRLGVLADGATISLYINGNLVETINDSSLTRGSIGVFVATGTGTGWSTGVFSRMTVYTVEKAKAELGARPEAITTAPRPTVAATSAPRPGATYPPGILFDDDFSSEQASKDKGWEIGTVGDVEAVWSPNKFALTLKSKSIIGMRMPTLPSRSDFGVEVEAQPEDNPGTRYGIVFRYRETANKRSYYLFAITLDGKYYVHKLVDSKWADIDPVPLTASSVIKQGAAKNRLGVLAEGTKISLYINGNLVKTITDDSIASGTVGLAAITGENPLARVAFSRMTIYTVEKAKTELGTTSAPRATATISSGILFNENFSSEQASRSKGWGFGAEASADYTWSPNKFTITAKKKRAILWAMVPAGAQKDFGVEIEAQPEDKPGIEYGLMLRLGGSADARSYYLFGVTTEGKYFLYKKIGGEWADKDPVSDTSSSSIKSGAAKNRLGVLMEGAKISLYINGVLVKTITDDSIASGSVALFVDSRESERAAVAFSRVTFYTVEKAKTELGKR